jgi:hypothetical protein
MKGKITEEQLYRLKNINEDKKSTYKDTVFFFDTGWFTKREGDKAGLEFGIPLQHPQYDEKLEEKLSNLSEGDDVLFRLKCLNERGTKWICESAKTDFDVSKYLGF